MRMATSLWLAAAALAVLLVPGSCQRANGLTVEQRFQRLDLDGDGRLTRQELPGQWFDRLNADGDDVVTLAEARAAFNALQAERGEHSHEQLGMRTHKRIAYAQVEGVDEDLLSLDVYIPEPAADAPVAVFVHGGAWQRGDKAGTDGSSILKSFISRGYAVVSVNYRLAPQAPFPLWAEDVAAAIGWVHEHISDYGGDPDRLCLMGHSAGAHLVALVATDETYLARHGMTLGDVSAVVPLDTQVFDVAALARGPQEQLPHPYPIPFTDDPDVWTAASPITHVATGKGIPPMVIPYSGGMNPQRPNDGRRRAAEAFAEALQEAGVEAEVVPAPEKSHTQIAQEFGTDGDQVAEAVFAFLSRVMPEAGSASGQFESRCKTVMTWIEDVTTSAFATFGSHNQRVVETPQGIYLTYQINEPGRHQNGDWRLVMTRDLGATWTVVHSARGTRPPAVVADSAGNVHLVHSDPDSDRMHVYSFSGPDLVAHHEYSDIRCDAKFTALYDPASNNLCVATQYGRFLAIRLDTFSIVHDYQVFQDKSNESPYACAQYPQLALDSSGNIHFATTTSNLSNTHVYRNILHVFASALPDGELAWARVPRSGEGAAQSVVTPIRPDEEGEALEVNDEDERGRPGVVSVHLTNFICKGESLHFFYTVVRQGIPEWRTHYKRINRLTGEVDVDMDGDTTPIAGQTIVLKPYGGFFSTASIVDPDTPLYLTSGERDLGQIGVLVSHDNGATWLDYAITDEGPMTWSNITGARYSDGRILAAFTTAPRDPAYSASVKYLGFYPRER